MATDPPLTPARLTNADLTPLADALHEAGLWPDFPHWADPAQKVADKLMSTTAFVAWVQGREQDAANRARAGAEAELLALRPVVEAAVAWREWLREYAYPLPAEVALSGAVDAYRGLSGRAVSGEEKP